MKCIIKPYQLLLGAYGECENNKFLKVWYVLALTSVCKERNSLSCSWPEVTFHANKSSFSAAKAKEYDDIVLFFSLATYHTRSFDNEGAGSRSTWLVGYCMYHAHKWDSYLLLLDSFRFFENYCSNYWIVSRVLVAWGCLLCIYKKDSLDQEWVLKILLLVTRVIFSIYLDYST